MEIEPDEIPPAFPGEERAPCHAPDRIVVVGEGRVFDAVLAVVDGTGVARRYGSFEVPDSPLPRADRKPRQEGIGESDDVEKVDSGARVESVEPEGLAGRTPCPGFPDFQSANGEGVIFGPPSAKPAPNQPRVRVIKGPFVRDAANRSR